MKYRFMIDFVVDNPLTDEDMLEMDAYLEDCLWNVDIVRMTDGKHTDLSGLEIIDSSLKARCKE